ncbi:rRNA maturation RNase YbeY [Candidatus Kaiserbacteria bacterium]|nr:rRNA maturation RNase YbeY [Candidatus Kaiserbacteria bacterium]
MSNFTISSTARSYPALPYEAIKKAVLGSAYDASLVFVGAKRAQDLNRAHRQKDYVPNVLSFPLAETAGEIYICPAVAKREAKKFNLSYRGYVGYLFIHGLLHLHGHDHGVAMDRLEQKYLRQFKLR